MAKRIDETPVRRVTGIIKEERSPGTPPDKSGVKSGVGIIRPVDIQIQKYARRFRQKLGISSASPVDGYVFNLTQFTVGGVTGPGEVLLDVVPANAPIVVTAMIEPKDIDKIREGMDARVRFTGLNQRWHGPMAAKVVLVSADKIVNEKSGTSFYRADLKVDAKELTKLKRTAQITPGMPAQVMIVTGEKTVMGSLISPITDTLHGALHD